MVSYRACSNKALQPIWYSSPAALGVRPKRLIPGVGRLE